MVVATDWISFIPRWNCAFFAGLASSVVSAGLRLPSHQIPPPTEKLETIFIYPKEFFLFKVHKCNTGKVFFHHWMGFPINTFRFILTDGGTLEEFSNAFSLLPLCILMWGVIHFNIYMEVSESLLVTPISLCSQRREVNSCRVWFSSDWDAVKQKDSHLTDHLT